jgi:hypothetical protein
MMIRCPKCERIGRLPVHLGSIARMVRCRRCRARISIVPSAAKEGRSLAQPLFEASPTAETVSSLARFSSETRTANVDEQEDWSPRPVGPDDSQYELPVSTDVDIEDSQVELPAFTLEASSPNDRSFGAGDDPPSVELMVSSSWYYTFIDSWGRYHLGVAIGFGALSLVLLGFFLAREILGGQTIGASITLLIVGCVGMVAFMLLSVTVTALNRQLAELAKYVRRMRIHSEPKTRIVGE